METDPRLLPFSCKGTTQNEGYNSRIFLSRGKRSLLWRYIHCRWQPRRAWTESLSRCALFLYSPVALLSFNRLIYSIRSSLLIQRHGRTEIKQDITNYVTLGMPVAKHGWSHLDLVDTHGANHVLVHQKQGGKSSSQHLLIFPLFIRALSTCNVTIFVLFSILF